MRLLLGVPDLDLASGGIAAVAQRLAAELAAQSHEVALAYSVDPAQPRLPVPDGVQALEFPRAGSPLGRWRQARQRLDGWIARRPPALLHDHGLWRPENAAVQSAARAHGLPLIVQPCGMLQDWPMRQSRLKKRLAWMLYQRRLLAGARAVIATGADERRETATRLPAGPALACIPHGVELPELPEWPRARRAVFLGRLHPKKQVDLLLRAWARLRPAGWRLEIAGNGEPAHEQALHTLAHGLGLDPASVRFLGPVHGEAKTALLAGSQLFLQPSLQENFGLAVAEALAHGLPVLASRAMPWSELETDGAGWWVAPDADAVEAALAQALALPAPVLAAMGARARRLARRYGWAESARRTLDLYRQVLESPP